MSDGIFDYLIFLCKKRAPLISVPFLNKFLEGTAPSNESFLRKGADFLTLAVSLNIIRMKPAIASPVTRMFAHPDPAILFMNFTFEVISVLVQPLSLGLFFGSLAAGNFATITLAELVLPKNGSGIRFKPLAAVGTALLFGFHGSLSSLLPLRLADKTESCERDGVESGKREKTTTTADLQMEKGINSSHK